MQSAWTRRIAVSVFVACSALGAAHGQQRPVVHLAVGDLVGIREGGVTQYRGIPYAEPPVGALRWAAPQPARPWAGQREAGLDSVNCSAGAGSLTSWPRV